MNTFQVTEIKDKTYFTQELGIDNTFILLNPAIPFSTELRNLLLKWEFKTVVSEGDIGIAKNPFNVQKSTSDSQQDQTSAKSAMDAGIKKALQEAKEQIGHCDETKLMEVIQNVYNEYLNYITAVYTRYATHKELEYDNVSKAVFDLCVFVKENKRFVLRINPASSVESSKDFLINHSLRSTILGIVIGFQLNLPLSRLVELGVSCILHELGQIRLPPQLYITQRHLSESEKTQLATHPVIGFNILKDCKFPLSIQLGVLQHHERENGTGYPRKLSSSKISLYAKIISVACSYEAITAPRHYKAQKNSFEAMVEMLRNTEKAYDDTVIRALLLSVSLYPIGGFVLLSNGRYAQVTDINPGDPKNPVVQLIGVKDERGNSISIQTDNEANKIVKVISKEEMTRVLGGRF